MRDPFMVYATALEFLVKVDAAAMVCVCMPAAEADHVISSDAAPA